MNTTDYDDDGFVYIPKWIYRLDLTLSETAAYGIIYAFSQDKQGCYFGSLDYLAHYCKVSRRHAMRILQKLEDAGLIIRESHPGSTTHFYAVDKREVTKLHPRQNVTGDNMSPHPCYNVTPTRDIMSPNNKDDNKDYNIDTESPFRAREDDGKKAYGTKVRMTPDEYAKIVSRYGADDAAAMVQMLDDYLVDHPRKHYANHYRAAIGWPALRLAEQRTAEQRLKNAQEAGQRAATPQQQYSGYGAVGLAASKRLEELLKQN